MIKLQCASLCRCLSASALLGLLVLLIEPMSVQAQWTTNGNNINNTNTGNVGVGTTSPQSKLSVNTSTQSPGSMLEINNRGDMAAGSWSAIRFGLDSSSYPNQYAKGGIIYESRDGYNRGRLHLVANTAPGTANISLSDARLTVDGATGNVGIGLTSPTSKLDVDGNINASKLSVNTSTQSPGSLLDINNRGDMAVGSWSAIRFGLDSSTYPNQYAKGGIIYESRDGYNRGRLHLVANTAPGTANISLSDARLTVDGTTGNVGIGTISPTEKIHVDGNGKITGNLVVDGNIAAKYQDLAEWVPAVRALPPGTVVTLNPTQSNLVEASLKAYDTRVAGVISERPGIALGERGENKVLVATSGRVRIKVDATHAPIEIGDLLVTSGKEGVAMKSVPINVGGVEIHRPGTLIGKALERLAKGEGEVLVLLSLQ